MPKSVKKAPSRETPSKKTRELVAKGRTYYVQAYKPREMILSHGKGSRVWDLDGNDYIDLGAGIAVTGAGHRNRRLIKALTAQAQKLWHTSNIFFSEPPILLAAELVQASGFAKRVFLSNSGAEANEAAIKLARKYAADQGKPPERREILTFTGSFHGRTLAAVTATAQPKYHQGFEPLPPGFRYAPLNDIAALEKVMAGGTVCAVLVEPIQGEGGVTPTQPGFLKAMQDLCHKHGALLMLDEVQCGMGRTGSLFAYMHEPGVKPDVVTLAKALGGGMPIGAMLVGEKAAETFQFGSHGSTFGGNPMAASVAREVLALLQSKQIRANVKMRGKQLVAGLEALNKRHGLFAEIRGRGLMIGAELKPQWHGKAGDISEAARVQGVLVLQAGPDVLRFVPALTITQGEMKEGLKRLQAAAEAVCSASAR